MITTQGKNVIQRYLAGQTPLIAGSIAVGIGDVSPTLADKNLTFEFDRATVDVTSVDLINQRIIFKGTLPQSTYGTIYEVGIYTSINNVIGNNYNSKTLLSFDSNIEQWTNATFEDDHNRLGAESLRVHAGSSSTTTAVSSGASFDLGGYSSQDVFTLTLFVTGSIDEIYLRFRGPDPASFFSYNLAGIVPGYNTVTFTKASAAVVGSSVTWDSINSIALVVAGDTGGGDVDFDGLRVETVNNFNKDNILVARTVLDTQTVKTNISPMDVEYALDITI